MLKDNSEFVDLNGYFNRDDIKADTQNFVKNWEPLKNEEDVNKEKKVRNLITKKALFKFLKKYRNIFFQSNHEYSEMKKEFVHYKNNEKYQLVFGFGDNYENKDSVTTEYCGSLDPNDIFASLDKWINFYKVNDVFDLYLTEESHIRIDINNQDDDCLYILGWDTVKKYQAIKEKELKEQEIGNERE